MQRTRCPKVNLQSKVFRKILNEFVNVQKTESMKRLACGGSRVLDLLIMIFRVFFYAPHLALSPDFSKFFL